MGSGIAQICAQSGFEVRLRDIDYGLVARGRNLIEKTLNGAIERKKLTPMQRDEVLHRIRFTSDLPEAVRGSRLVIEAIFENEAQKRKVFEEVGVSAPPDAIIATNTSSLSVSRLQTAVPNPERFAGLHFFFPAAINKLLEVVSGAGTSPSTLAILENLASRLKKIPIRVRDSAGFAVNRFFVPYLNEATRLAEEQVASLATIEEVGRQLFGTTLGPFELMNVTGIPIAFHSETSLAAAFGPAYEPSKLLEAQFRTGRPWAWKETSVEPDHAAAVRERLRGLVFGIATRLVEEGVATAEATDRGATIGLRWRRGPFALLSEAGIPESLATVEAFASRWGAAFPVSEELRRRAARGDRQWPLQLVRVEREAAVAWVLLDRPEVMNAPNSAVLHQLKEAFESLETDTNVRVVILAGASPVFAAGADIAEMVTKDAVEGRAFGFAGQAVCQRIEEFRTPVIALVEGYALGGGLELALACDFIVAAKGALLGLPEVSVGIHPGWGGATRLSRQIGEARAKLLVYSGVPITAEEAADQGIVVKVFGQEEAREQAKALAELIASRAPLGVQWVKSVINRGLDLPLEEALKLEGESAGKTFLTSDRSEGMRAFLERRLPRFEGK